MRRLLRWTFNALPAALLLLCVAVQLPGLRDHDLGVVKLDRFRVALFDPTGYGFGAWVGDRDGLLHGADGYVLTDIHQLGGWCYLEQAEKGARRGWVAVVRYRLIGAVILPLAIAWLCRSWANHQRELRSQRGLCPACGYDLRASPGRCPECGAVPAKHEIRSTKPETISKLEEETGKTPAPF